MRGLNRQTKMAAMGALLGVSGLVLVPAITVQAASPPVSHRGSPKVPYFNHVFVIMMENHSYNDLMYENDVPYIHQLAQRYGLATQYYGVTNPSVGNRVGILSGTTAGTELPHSKTTGLTQPSLIDQLSAHHLSWGAFYEHSRLSSSSHPIYNYQHGHSTFLRFADIANNPARIAHLHPLRSLTAELATNHGLPNYVWIGANSIGNMEGGYRSPGQFTFQGAGPGGATAADRQLERGGNNFLATWIPRIMHSKAWHQGHNAIFITWDETSYNASNPVTGYWLSDHGAPGSPVIPAGTNLAGNSQYLFPGGVDGGGHALALVISNTAHHVVSATPYNEYSVLKTIEAGWHLGYLGHAANAQVHTMAAFFGHASGRSAPPRSAVGTLSTYDAHLMGTPVASSATTPQAHTATSLATLSTTTNPYLARGVSHQVGTTVTIQESQAGVLNHTLTFTLPSSESGVRFARQSSPVGSTQIANPSDQGVQFAPSSAAARQVSIPVVTPSAVPSTAVITGLVLDVSPHAQAGPVIATVSSGNHVLGTVTLGTVGRPTALTAPQMMAPVVLNHLMAFPFVPGASQRGNHSDVLRIEGQYPTARSQDLNQYASFTTKTNVPVVSDTAVDLTSQAGKQYWAEVRPMNHPASWSSAVTFSVSR